MENPHPKLKLGWQSARPDKLNVIIASDKDALITKACFCQLLAHQSSEESKGNQRDKYEKECFFHGFEVVATCSLTAELATPPNVSCYLRSH